MNNGWYRIKKGKEIRVIEIYMNSVYGEESYVSIKSLMSAGWLFEEVFLFTKEELEKYVRETVSSAGPTLHSGSGV